MIATDKNAPVRIHAQAGLSRLPLLLVAIVVLGLLGFFIFGGKQPEPEQTSVPAEPPASPPFALPPSPDIPLVEPSAPEEQPVILPDLDNSDAFVREELMELNDTETYALWLQSENLLQRGTALIDGLSRGVVLRKILPIAPPSGKFSPLLENNKLWLDEASFHRYDPLTDLIVSIDGSALVTLFHKFRPLAEQAYAELGYDKDELDNAVIRAIDQILATPEIDGPVELVQESVNYQFADPELERLPAIQKQILRMGPDNAARIKEYLRTVREALVPATDVTGNP